MRITFLLEVADQLWGGVKVALEDANWLADHGHQVTVVSRSGPPAWMQLRCAFRRVQDFRPEHLPDGDVVIGTFWSTVPWAAGAGPDKGVPVHFCQGYEGDNPESERVRDRIEAAYRLPGLQHLTISPHLTALLRNRFGIAATELRYVVDHTVHRPAPTPKPVDKPLRVGLVGPYQVAWKDLPTGYEACRLASEAGQPLVLVRASNTPPSPEEQAQLPFAIEWHQQLKPSEMGDYYRSLDVFLGTSSGREEGFFLPAIEAMACGIPAVLTDIPCFRNHADLVGHDRYALFVEPRDPAAMAEALVLAGAMPDLRDAMRTGGLEVAARYRIDEHGRQLEAALQRFVNAKGPRAPQRAGPVIEPAPAARQPQTQPQPQPQPQPSSSHELRLVPKPIPTPATIPTGAAGNDGGHDYQRLANELQRAAESERRRGDHDRAARLFMALRCLADEPHAGLTLTIGQCLLAAGRPEQSLAVFDAQLANGDDDEQMHVGRGNALHALGRMAEAAQAFRAALAIGARNADNYNRLGVVLFQAGDLQAARRSFERALVLDPQHADARANLGALPAA